MLWIWNALIVHCYRNGDNGCTGAQIHNAWLGLGLASVTS
ncbi:MAG: hypothetical protein K0R96_2202 [Pantoea agglomerans]|nr:hypothetical protein [Pantoea agglomerans]